MKGDSSVGRALVLYTTPRRFKSCSPYHFQSEGISMVETSAVTRSILVQLQALTPWGHSAMVSISEFHSEDAGSTPAGPVKL